MSTRLTSKNTPMVDSESLRLLKTVAKLSDSTVAYLSKKLKNKGYSEITPISFNFLSALECGVNYGSEIARNLGVSRQMVAKTVKELCRLGYLEQHDGKGKQKEILFTKKGELLIADARQLLADIDLHLKNHIDVSNLSLLFEQLDEVSQIINKLEQSIFKDN